MSRLLTQWWTWWQDQLHIAHSRLWAEARTTAAMRNEPAFTHVLGLLSWTADATWFKKRAPWYGEAAKAIGSHFKRELQVNADGMYVPFGISNATTKEIFILLAKAFIRAVLTYGSASDAAVLLKGDLAMGGTSLMETWSHYHVS